MSIDYDTSNESDHKRKKRNKKKSHRKKETIKLFTKLTEKLLTTVYKSKIINFKLDEDTLHNRIYFLTFMESLEMIFPRYKETSEVLLYYPKIGGEENRDFVKKVIRNLLHANINAHSKRLIAELPGDGVKCISKLHSHCANINFSRKSRYGRASNT